jgi:radical SAM protein with 4Fe4S-binding SPASM domain
MSVQDRVPVAMAQRFGNRLNFAPYFPISGEVSSLSITGVDYFRALKQAQGVRPLGCCEQALEGAIGSPCHKCAIGDGEFSISATGDVYPCQLLHTETFYAGNVHEQPIVDIYRHATALERCARLDVDTMEGCRTCLIKYICGGSCRARAYYGCGNVAAASDFCTYEREAFYDGIVALYAQNGVDEEIRQ